jgi:hypothetical protein
MKKTCLFIFLAIFLTGCSLNFGSSQTVAGSGIAASETRDVSGFTSIELAGSADVFVNFGDTESVKIETDDNILPLIETNVSFGKLVIRTRPNTNTTTHLGIRVTVTAKSLAAASISGSGNLTINDARATDLRFDLPGSGNITTSGKAERVNIILNGSGNILCGNLQSKSATVRLGGSGNINVYAAESLDASITGSGSVFYAGNPAKVNTSVPGSGTIIPQK